MKELNNGYDKDGLYRGDIRHFRVLTDKFIKSREKSGEAHSKMVNKQYAWSMTHKELVAEIHRVTLKYKEVENMNLAKWYRLRLSDYRYVYKRRFGGAGWFKRLTKGLA